MIDSLKAALPRARESRIHEKLELSKGAYALATVHRPANVDDPARLRKIVDALVEVSRELPVVFPLHPRTRRRLEEEADLESSVAGSRNLLLVEPLLENRLHTRQKRHREPQPVFRRAEIGSSSQ